MFKVIVLVPLLALCQAAPFSSNDNPTIQPQTILPRPSPINPDIPSDPKPEERITLIKNPDNNEMKYAQPGTAMDIQKQKDQHEDCHSTDRNKDISVPSLNEKDAKNEKEDDKGIIKRDTTSTENAAKNSEKSNKQSDQPPAPCTGEGCENPENHSNHKRETETTRTTEAPGTSSKGKSKPYVASKPENFAQKMKRDVQPPPEQPDEGDNKKDDGKVPKRDIPVSLTPVSTKPKDPNSQSENSGPNDKKDDQPKLYN